METYSHVLVWKIPQTEESGGLQKGTKLRRNLRTYEKKRASSKCTSK